MIWFQTSSSGNVIHTLRSYCNKFFVSTSAWTRAPTTEGVKRDELNVTLKFDKPVQSERLRGQEGKAKKLQTQGAGQLVHRIESSA